MNLLFVLLSLFPVFADHIDAGPLSRGVFPWLILGVLAICIGVTVWVYRKKKR